LIVLRAPGTVAASRRARAPDLSLPAIEASSELFVDDPVNWTSFHMAGSMDFQVPRQAIVSRELPAADLARRAGRHSGAFFCIDSHITVLTVL
jgi:hypothetical protein